MTPYSVTQVIISTSVTINDSYTELTILIVINDIFTFLHLWSVYRNVILINVKNWKKNFF